MVKEEYVNYLKKQTQIVDDDDDTHDKINVEDRKDYKLGNMLSEVSCKAGVMDLYKRGELKMWSVTTQFYSGNY